MSPVQVFLRIVLPVYPDASAHFQELMLLISLASILYGSVLAFTTPDSRLILGYSSVAQLGFITLGIFSLISGWSEYILPQVLAPLLRRNAVRVDHETFDVDVARFGEVG